MRRTIRLKESELRRMISECVKRTLNEFEDSISDYKDLDRRKPKYPFDDDYDDDYDDLENMTY